MIVAAFAVFGGFAEPFYAATNCFTEENCNYDVVADREKFACWCSFDLSSCVPSVYLLVDWLLRLLRLNWCF